MSTIGDMRVVIKDENEEAVERVRKAAGDHNPTETVNRLIREADAEREPMTRADAAANRRVIRRGVRS